MTEPAVGKLMEDVSKMKMLVAVLWVTLITAVIITLIDFKIKQDILKSAADFYMKMGSEVPNVEQKRGETPGETPGRGPVLPIPDVDHVAGVEARILGEKGIATSKSRNRSRNVRRGEVGNTPDVPAPVVGTSDSDES